MTAATPIYDETVAEHGDPTAPAADIVRLVEDLNARLRKVGDPTAESTSDGAS